MSVYGGPGQPTVYIAHRGGSLEAPENTLAAARHGVRSGAAWQECDVTLSADGVPVVIHDDSLERTTDGAGLVEAHTALRLRQLQAGQPQPDPGTLAELQRQNLQAPHFSGHRPDTGVPTLAAWLAVPGLCPMLELKQTRRVGPLAAAVVAALAVRPLPRSVVGSFDPALLEAVHAGAPAQPLLGIAGPELDLLPRLLALPLRALAVDKQVLAAVRPRVPAALPLWVWTVYSPAEAARLVRAGAHGIITDAPQACLAAAA